MTREFTQDFHIVLQWIPSDHSYMLTMVALALFSFCLNGLPLIAMVEQLLLPAWGSSNMTFTNETDDNPAEVKLKSQDWVDNGTLHNLLDGYMVLPKMKNWIITIYPLSICMCVVIIIQIIYSIILYVIETQMVRMKTNQFECISVYLLSSWITEIRYE